MESAGLRFDARGLEKFSLVEWPGKITAIIFAGGCNFRCPFCHNPELVTNLEKTPVYPWTEIEKFLDRKKGWVDAIMITGGEPTIQTGLPKVLEIIKGAGYLSGIATNGSNPEMLEKIVKAKLTDRICMDIKSSPNKYEKVCGIAERANPAVTHLSEPLKQSPEKDVLGKIRKSIKIIINSNVEYEFKLTIVPEIVEKEDIPEIGKLVKGAKKISLQQFRPLKTLDKSYQNKVPYCKDEIEIMARELERYVKKVNSDFIE